MARPLTMRAGPFHYMSKKKGALWDTVWWQPFFKPISSWCVMVHDKNPLQRLKTIHSRSNLSCLLQMYRVCMMFLWICLNGEKNKKNTCRLNRSSRNGIICPVEACWWYWRMAVISLADKHIKYRTSKNLISFGKERKLKMLLHVRRSHTVFPQRARFQWVSKACFLLTMTHKCVSEKEVL